MKALKKNEKKEFVVVIGCSRLGANIANTLSDNDGNVSVVDKTKDAFRKLSPSFGGLTIVGDGTDLDVLQEAQINKASIVIVVTNNDNVNVMISLLAKRVFKVKNIITRLYDPELNCIYNHFEIETICPSVLSVNEIDKIISNDVIYSTNNENVVSVEATK